MNNLEFLSQNRTENFGFDLFDHFVIPFFFNKVNPSNYTKPMMIVGGRGCGKTMLLRYFCHETQFSTKIESLSFRNLNYLGLYLKMDSQFSRAFYGRGLEFQDWENAFEHYLVLNITLEFFKSIRSMLNSNLSVDEKNIIEKWLKTQAASYLHILEIDNEMNALDKIRILKQKFEIWIRKPSIENIDFFLPKSFILDIVNSFTLHVFGRKDFIVHLFLDEYENLREYQQILVNTWLKHSEKTFIVNLAMRKNGLKTIKALENETLSDTHDYRIVDIEDEIKGERFEIFASEILLNILKVKKIKIDEFDQILIRQPESVYLRINSNYQTNIRNIMHVIFPGLDLSELAEYSIENSGIVKSIYNKIIQNCKIKNLNIEKILELFEQINDPKIKIIFPYVILRKNASTDLLNREISKSKRGEENIFTKKGGWIDNNFIDCLLDVYEPYDRSCPLYAGFRVICTLSNGNIRHFLELCFKCFLEVSDQIVSFPFTIEVMKQAEAIKETSERLFKDTKSLGEEGNRLQVFTNRLGHLFSINRRNPKKSRSEVIQFSVEGGELSYVLEIQNFLKEAEKYSIISVSKVSQRFNKNDPELNNYTLNPIFSPYFLITYRKRKKINLTVQELKTLIFGTFDEYRLMLRHFNYNLEGLTENIEYFENRLF